jgi:alkyl sulfatase BDS1-like metallo-beta-lactamase superfamily hydrolase
MGPKSEGQKDRHDDVLACSVAARRNQYSFGRSLAFLYVPQVKTTAGESRAKHTIEVIVAALSCSRREEAAVVLLKNM